MIITRINKQNEEYFIPMLHEQARNDRPDFLRIGVTDDDQRPAGALSAIVGSREVLMMSVYVDPDFRKQGYGRALVDSLINLADTSGCETVSVYAKNSDGTEDFLRALGFELFEAVGTCNIRICDLLKSEKLEKYLLGRIPGNIRNISSLDIEEIRHFRSFLSENRIYAGTDYDTDCSTVYLKDDKITSAALTVEFPGGLEVTCAAERGVNEKEAFAHLAALVQCKLREQDYDLASELRLVSADWAFEEVFGSLEIDTGYIPDRGAMIHGIRMLQAG